MSILDELTSIARYINSLPPAPVAIWLIDRPEVYFRIKNLVHQAQTLQLLSAGYQAIDGLPIYVWTSDDIASRLDDLRLEGRWSEAQLDKLYPFRSTGAYVQMSKGQHIRLEGL